MYAFNVGFLLGVLVLHAAAFQTIKTYIDALQQFGTDFIDPARIVEQRKTSTLADDVVGRIDMTTNFFGKEINVEYLYGLFLAGARANTTQLIPTPIKTVPQALVIEQPVAFVSFITDFFFSSVNLTFPLQIDVIVRFDDETMKVTSYDATLRRWSEFWDYFIPFLVPKAAEELMAANTIGVDYGNSTDIIVHRAATDICTVAQTYCVGDNKQYDSYDQCFEFLTKKVPFGAAWSGGGNTGFCRYIHKNMVTYRPEVHCPHIGPTGGHYCIARNYTDVVLNPPFHESLIAIKASEYPLISDLANSIVPSSS